MMQCLITSLSRTSILGIDIWTTFDMLYEGVSKQMRFEIKPAWKNKETFSVFKYCLIIIFQDSEPTDGTLVLRAYCL